MKCYKIFSITLVLLNVISFSHAMAEESADAYQLPITRNGKTETRVSYTFWSGEYPQPVIDVNSGSKGTTKIHAFQSLRALDKKMNCTIENGIYHPWAKPTPTSLANFYTLIELEEYQSLKDQELEGVKIKKGERLTQVRYLSEGTCAGELVVRGSKPRRVDFTCDQVDDRKLFQLLRKISPENRFQEQWLYLKCKEGFSAFVLDQDLLKHSGVKPGAIKGYGEVGRAD